MPDPVRSSPTLLALFTSHWYVYIIIYLEEREPDNEEDHTLFGE